MEKMKTVKVRHVVEYQTGELYEGVRQVVEYQTEGLGYSIYFIKIEGGSDYDYKRSKELLNKLGLELVPPQKFFMAILNNPELLNAAKGEWGYLAGKGFDKSGFSAINDKTGELETPKQGESIEKLVYTWSGKWPLRVKVHSDDDTTVVTGRFSLDANHEPSSIASAVFGIKYEDAVRGAFIRLDASAAKVVKRQ